MLAAISESRDKVFAWNTERGDVLAFWVCFVVFVTACVVGRWLIWREEASDD